MKAAAAADVVGAWSCVCIFVCSRSGMFARDNYEPRACNACESAPQLLISCITPGGELHVTQHLAEYIALKRSLNPKSTRGELDQHVPMEQLPVGR